MRQDSRHTTTRHDHTARGDATQQRSALCSQLANPYPSIGVCLDQQTPYPALVPTLHGALHTATKFKISSVHHRIDFIARWLVAHRCHASSLDFPSLWTHWESRVGGYELFSSSVQTASAGCAGVCTTTMKRDRPVTMHLCRMATAAASFIAHDVSTFSAHAAA